MCTGPARTRRSQRRIGRRRRGPAVGGSPTPTGSAGRSRARRRARRAGLRPIRRPRRTTGPRPPPHTPPRTARPPARAAPRGASGGRPPPQHLAQSRSQRDRIGELHSAHLVGDSSDRQGCRRGHGSLPMIELGVRTARSSPGPCPHPHRRPRVAAAQRLLTATMPTPWPDGGLECGSGKAHTELGQETGQGARCSGAVTWRCHRR